MTRKGLRIDANYVEDVVAIEIAAFLARVSFPDLRFSIEPMSRAHERWFGADARLSDSMAGFLPFYMQFKRPSAYPDTSASRIIRDRTNFKPTPLQTSPRVLFFSLRNKKPEHHEYQHNVLYHLRQRLRSRQLGDAAYVCPLFLDRQAYIQHFHTVALIQALRLRPHHVLITSPITVFSGISSKILDDVPLLREHSCIPPHALVTSAKHSYSFTESGDHVCFHSPKSLPEGSMALGRWLARMTGQGTQQHMVSGDEAREALYYLIKGESDEELLTHPREVFEERDPIAAWMMWGEHLLREHSIEQYALVQWKD